MSPSDAERPISVRTALARLAAEVVAADAGVGAAREGGRWVTRDGDRVIPGVVVTAAGSGRVDVDLHLVAYLPPRPLARQAESLRAALLAAARRTGVAASLGEIDVTVHDLVEPEASVPGHSAPETPPGLLPPRIGGVEV
jgi:hypothetical protein